jgi:hypothetical protein
MRGARKFREPSRGHRTDQQRRKRNGHDNDIQQLRATQPRAGARRRSRSPQAFRRARRGISQEDRRDAGGQSGALAAVKVIRRWPYLNPIGESEIDHLRKILAESIANWACCARSTPPVPPISRAMASPDRSKISGVRNIGQFIFRRYWAPDHMDGNIPTATATRRFSCQARCTSTVRRPTKPPPSPALA